MMLLWVGGLSGEGGGIPSSLFLYVVHHANRRIAVVQPVTSDVYRERIVALWRFTEHVCGSDDL